MIRNAVTLERERKEYERTTKLQEKELQESLDRKRRKPISVRSYRDNCLWMLLKSLLLQFVALCDQFRR